MGTSGGDLSGTFGAPLEDVSALLPGRTNTNALLAGDGVTNDLPALLTARDGMISEGIIRFPGNKTYLLTPTGAPAVAFGITKDMTVRGDGMWVTTLKAGGNPIINAVANTPVNRVTFEDLCLDGGASVATLLASFNGNPVVRQVIFRRCRFTDIKSGGTATTMQGGELIVEDCLFHNPASLAGFGNCVLAQAGCRVKFRRNKVRYMGQVLATEAFSGDSHLSEYIKVVDNDIDQGWSVIPTSLSGSGGTVSYTATVLTDTAANFSSVTAGAYPNMSLVRILPVRFDSTASATTGITLVNPAALVDAGATFQTAGVAKGDIVRVPSANCFGIVNGVESQTVARVEEWLDNATYLPTANPPVGSAYTVYQFLYAYPSAKTTTTLTFPYITDFFGNRVTPAAGTLYEIMQSRPNQMFSPGASTRRVLYQGNTLMRPWADAFGTTAQRTIITENIIKDGQDNGVTIQGGDCIVANNLIEHCGSGGIFSNGNDNIIVNNKIKGCGWNFTSTANVTSAITAHACSRNTIVGNDIEANSDGIQAFAGVACTTSGGNHEIDNTWQGFPANQDVYVDNAAITGVRVRNTQSVSGVANAAWLLDTLPSQAITSGALPTTSAFTSGAGKQINAHRGVTLAVPITFNPTAGASATCLIELSPDNVTYSVLGTETIPAGVTFDGTIRVLTIPVPAGWYVRLTVTNATIGTGTYW